MLKKLFAGLTAFALSLGLAALTVGPASATVTHNSSSATPTPDLTPYVLVAWIMPGWIDATHPTWGTGQIFFKKLDVATKDLDALDDQLMTCGTNYQVDLYNDSATTALLIAGGVLYAPHNPDEDFPQPQGWDLTYKLIHNPNCQTTPTPATFDPGECVEGSPGLANYTIPFTPGVKYTVQINGAGGFGDMGLGTYYVPVGTKVEVKAVELPGHTLIGTTEWSTTFAIPDCLATPATPTVTSAVCVVDPGGSGSYVSGYIVIPNSPHVEYFIDGSATPATGQVTKAPGTYSVTAKATGGYALIGYPAGGWNLEIFAADPCGDLIILPVVDPEVTFKQTTCTASGFYTLAVEPVEESTGVIWTVSGGLPNSLGSHNVATVGTVIVTATAAPGYGLSGDEDGFIQWTFAFTNAPDDCLPTLALTGGSTATGGLGLGALLTLGGLLLVLARKREAMVPGE